jgi:hypothetical protein
LHSEELHNLYSSPNIIRQIRSRRLRWAGHVVCMGDERTVWAYEALLEKPEVKSPGKTLGVDGRLGSDWLAGGY